MAKMSKFIDTSKCTACRGCQTACKSWNELPAEILDFQGSLQTHNDTSPTTFTFVKMQERKQNDNLQWFFMKRQCMHCTEAACAKVCPQKAISRTEQGAVVRDKEKCMGCDYCEQYCPFHIPKISQQEMKMYKCDLCSDRVAAGLKPACVQTCATGAIEFGPRSELVSAAKARLAEVKKVYPKANLYGLDDQFLGGTNVFYLLLEEPAFYGLDPKPQIPAVAGVWQDWIQPLGKIMPIGALGAIAASAFMTRVAKVSEANKQQEKGGKSHG